MDDGPSASPYLTLGVGHHSGHDTANLVRDAVQGAHRAGVDQLVRDLLQSGNGRGVGTLFQ